MTRKQALIILGLQEGSDAEEIKRAYRKLAFALHPDLHPDNPDAGKEFQQLNEAYVLLSSPPGGHGQARQAPRGSARPADDAQATEKARADAEKAYAKAKKRFQETTGGASSTGPSTKRPVSPKGSGDRSMSRDDVLQSLLRDPFARRVFEDIYSQIREETARNKTQGRSASNPTFLEKTAENVSGWFRRQIDEELTVRLTGPLTPGKRVRLQINHGVFGKPQTVELTLPQGFEPGRPIRLKGLGKRLGSWHGDLYLRILEQ